MNAPKSRFRRIWDPILASEGRSLGLTRCCPFLENKTVNDIFYDGFCQARPCIVKCSSKAADALQNEYALLQRLHRAAPRCVPQPFAFWSDEKTGRAFLAMEKIGGPPLGELMARGLDVAERGTFSEDLLRLAETLAAEEIVHRDLFADNLLLGADGHLKAIDFQFAIDRRAPRECRWMTRNCKYRYVVFGVNHDLGLGVWNDPAALARIVRSFGAAPVRQNVLERLKRLEAVAAFRAPPSGPVRLQLRLYRLSIRLQLFFRRKPSGKRDRLVRRLQRLESL
jgi:serine/threonine protein kinase